MKVNMAMKEKAKTVRHWLQPESIGPVTTSGRLLHHLPQ